MGSEREAFDAMLAGRTSGRPAWVPRLEGLAARLQSTSFREMSADPDAWYAGLMRAGDMLGADALLVGAEVTLLAEACGAELDGSGGLSAIARRPDALAAQPLEARRLAALLEVLRRLRATVRARLGVVAALCGPLLLATQLYAEQAPEAALRQVKAVHNGVVDALLATRPDLLLLIERFPGTGSDVLKAWQRAFGTLRNLAAHYDVPLALRVEGWSADAVGELLALRLPVYVLGTGTGDAVQVARALAAPGTAVGVPLAPGAEAQAMLAAVAGARAAGSVCFLTTADDVGGQGDLGALREFAAGVRRAA